MFNTLIGKRLHRITISIAIGALSLFALLGLHFSPVWAVPLLALAIAGLAYLSVDVGLLAALTLMSLPILAVSPIVGLGFLGISLLTLRYLGATHARAFFTAAGTVAAVLVGPVWAVPGFVGYAHGAGPGAISAVVACVAAQGLGVLLGRTFLGGLAIGGVSPLLDFRLMPDSLLSPSWVGTSFSAVGPKAAEQLLDALSATWTTALLLQPLVWAVGASLAWWLATYLRKKGRGELAPLASGVGAAVAASASFAFAPLGDVSVIWMGYALLGSILLAPTLAYVWEYRLPAEFRQPSRKSSSQTPVVAMEDADVDELLRLIATAEEKLSSQHTTMKTVLITDMKSFSRMTEEDGSLLSARAVQRQRDLLIPIIQAYGGHGKSTGGDGLVAAFDVEAQALTAAAQMQRAIAEHNRTRANERDLSVRMGVANGEVVLDRNGRPFIGSALNVAARIMNLADGGQIFTTAEVLEKSEGAVASQDHGMFELRNIGRPVNIHEVVWRDTQEPGDASARESA